MNSISLILPYWDRQEAANKAIALLEKQYGYLANFEVVVVDDGNPVPFKPPATSLSLRVVTMPRKTEAKCPATAWNAGANAAKGDILVLSCIEVLHDKPGVIEGMLAELWKHGKRGYVLAAAWCPEQQAWHTHSTVSVPECPTGTGIAFCGMLYKELFLKAGGFDEEYREGAGYEDRDFIHRLTSAGARFVHRDDLVVTHPKAGATINWPGEKFERNKALFEKRWLGSKPSGVTFACLNAGNYCGRGAEYVNNLFDMVVRNLPGGTTFRFVCLTDSAEGLDPRIETLPLPKEIDGWYGKLYMFKRGLFPDGSRMVFMDLDTVILGALDDLIGYRGQFATLTDFYYPERMGPAVILWEAGDYAASIWDEWAAEGMPRDEYGDLWWLNNLDQGRFAKRTDRLQDLFPGQFVSYKKHCNPLPPKGTKVVCFHGEPRPHDAADLAEWVGMVWKVGGAIPADFEVVANTAREAVAKNIAAACKLDAAWLAQVGPHAGEIAIIGGAPSLTDMLDEVKAKVAAGMKVIAVNGAHDYLVDRGVVPDFHLIIDSRSECERFITRPAKGYLLASQCAPEVFAKAKGPVTVVHMHTAVVLDSIPDSIKPINLISTGSTVGLAGLGIAYCMGFRKLYVYGMDSSYEETRHAYPQSLNDQDRVIEAVAGGRKFKCAPWMVQQVQDFQRLATELANDGCEVHVRCYGLLGHVAWLWANQAKAA